MCLHLSESPPPPNSASIRAHRRVVVVRGGRQCRLLRRLGGRRLRDWRLRCGRLPDIASMRARISAMRSASASLSGGLSSSTAHNAVRRSCGGCRTKDCTHAHAASRFYLARAMSQYLCSCASSICQRVRWRPVRVPASKCLSHFCCEMLEPKRLYHCHMRAF